MRLLRAPGRFASVSVMLQQEVVDRLMAVPGNKIWGALSVEAQVRGQPVYLLRVPPESFHPPPKVNSSVVRFDLFDAPKLDGVDPQWFDGVVRAAFSHRRKTLPNSLTSRFGRDRARAALVSAGIDPGLRAEALDVAAFVNLARELSQSPTD
jgi:16S rRNA (adenine1518-N6/adenine1519-N6)-dimethyltransferase